MEKSRAPESFATTGGKQLEVIDVLCKVPPLPLATSLSQAAANHHSEVLRRWIDLGSWN
jgi:hypothetical protein